MRSHRSGKQHAEHEGLGTGGVPGRSTHTQRLPARKADGAEPAPGGPDPETLAAMDGRNRAALDAMFDFEGGGFARADEMMTAPLEIPHRPQMEAAFGQDFGGVQAHLGVPDAMGSIGARAAARGDRVAFAETSPSPWLVAHELTHVAQARQGGDAGGAARSATIGASDDAAEHEADAVADRVAAGLPAGAIRAAPASTVRRFSQEHHESATVGGLVNDFTAEEIGAIYAGNWERDFSQGVPEVANAVIAWQAVKNSKIKSGSVDPGAAGQFRGAAQALIDLHPASLATGTSLGGYQSWEHMDAVPGKPGLIDPISAQQKADMRWAGKSNGLAGYINDSKAHIKDHMVAAVDAYRAREKLGKIGGGIDNWDGVAKPAGYQAPAPGDGTRHTAQVSPGYDPGDVDSRDPIRERTTRLAKAENAHSEGYDSDLWKVVGQFLGRAMHAFEDFWAHSNWLELAIEAKEHGETAVANSELITGEFGTASKAHSLGHKLVGFSSSLQRDFDTLLEVYGRKSASKRLDRRAPSGINAVDYLLNPYGAAAGHAMRAASDPDSVGADTLYAELDANRPGVHAELGSTIAGLGAGKALVNSGMYSVEDLLCNRDVLGAIAAKGQKLIEEGDAASGHHDHGKVAKDAPEGGKGFGAAHALATEANQNVFGPLRAIMDNTSGGEALEQLEAQLAMVDVYLQAPSEDHPLWHLV